MVKMASAILWTHSAHFCHLGCSVGFPWNLQNILFSHWQWTMWAEYAMTGCASQSAHKNTVLKREGDEKRENTKKGGECIRGLEHDNRITTTNMPDHINTLCLIILRDAACPWNYFNMSSKTIINTTHTHTTFMPDFWSLTWFVESSHWPDHHPHDPGHHLCTEMSKTKRKLKSSSTVLQTILALSYKFPDRFADSCYCPS